MNVKDRCLSEPYPAWTAIGAASLGGVSGLVIEIKAVAVRRLSMSGRSPGCLIGSAESSAAMALMLVRAAFARQVRCRMSWRASCGAQDPLAPVVCRRAGDSTG